MTPKSEQIIVDLLHTLDKVEAERDRLAATLQAIASMGVASGREVAVSMQRMAKNALINVLIDTQK